MNKLHRHVVAQVPIQPIAFELGHSDASSQAYFINEFSRGLKSACSNESRTEMQLCYIKDELDENGKFLIKELYEFIKLEEDK